MRDSEQFNTLMRLPHRRFALGLNAPILVRHIGARLEVTGDQDEDPLTARDSLIGRQRGTALIEKLNYGLQKIQLACGHTPKTIQVFALDHKHITDTHIARSRTLINSLPRLPPELQEWRGRIQVDILAEAYFITLVLDQKNSKDCAHDIGEVEQALCSNHGQVPRTDEFLDTYYEAVWDQLREFLKDGFAELPGNRFTEFRGIVLRDLNSPYRKGSGTRSESLPVPQFDRSVTESARTSLRAWVTRNQAFLANVMQIKQASQDNDRDANCVLCGLLDGDAIYASSVRQTATEPTSRPHEAPRSKTPADTPPLRYFMLYNGLSKFQLGRLVRRTHQLGELRCACVLDYDQVIAASSRIRVLGNRIDHWLTTKDDGAVTTLTDQQLKDAHEELNSIAFGDIPGGLLYRINRSRYYAETFRQRIKEMRVQRLEGWQSYDDFFRRNLYPTFDQIDQIGARYAALANRINRLTVACNQTNIESMMVEVAALLRLGDVVGGAAFTYYGGHVLAKVVDGLWHLATQAAHAEASTAAPVSVGPPVPSLAIEIFCFAIALLAWMWIRKRILPYDRLAGGPGKNSLERPVAQ